MWYEREFADTFISAKPYEAITDLLWTDLVGSWTDQQKNWDEFLSSGKSNVIHLLSIAGLVHAYDYVTTLDNGAPIKYTIETKDFLVKNANIRFDLMEVYIQTLNTDVFYSTDGGDSWDTLGNINQFPQARVRLWQQFLGMRLRFRFTGTDTSLILEWLNIYYKIESLFDGGDS
jgi:hypothetical protein